LQGQRGCKQAAYAESGDGRDGAREHRDCRKDQIESDEKPLPRTIFWATPGVSVTAVVCVS
jgi:hypothetical protein